MVTIHWIDACIYRSLPLLAVHTGTTITVKHSEARLIMEDSVPPEPEVSPSGRSSPHMAASSVVQSQSVMPRPIASSRNPLPCSKLTNRSEIGWSPCADEQLGCNDCQWPFRLTVCLLRLLRPPSLWWCGRPMSRLHSTILLTNPCYTTFLPLLAENSQQSYNMHQFLFLKISWHDVLKEW